MSRPTANPPITSTLWYVWRPWWRLWLVVATLGLFVSASEAGSILLVMGGLESALAGEDGLTVPLPGGAAATLGWTVAAYIILALLIGRLALQAATATAIARLISGYKHATRASLNQAHLATPLETSHTDGDGQLLTLATHHTASVARALMMSTRVLTAGISVAVLLVSAFSLSPYTVVGMLGVVCLLALCVRPVTRYTRSRSKVLHRVILRFTAEAEQTASLSREVRVFGTQEAVQTRTDDLNRQFLQLQTRIDTGLAGVNAAYWNGGIAMLVLCVYALEQLIAGSVSLTAFALAARSLQYAQTLQTSLHVASERTALAEPIQERIEQSPALAQSSGVAPTSNDLALSKASFTAADGTPILHDICLELPHGTALGLAGPSGGGKTTLARLFAGLLQPTDGVYTVGTHRVCEVDQADWARRVGYVPQQPSVLTLTVRENIRFFREHVTDESIQRAVKDAGLEAFVAGLPEGLDTPIHANAVSGGEAQRIGTARGLAGDPKLLILDEPTSAIDANAERAFDAMLQTIKRSVSLVVIAHRLESLASMDQIAVLQAGRITALGPLDEVSTSNPWLRDAKALSSAPPPPT